MSGPDPRINWTDDPDLGDYIEFLRQRGLYEIVFRNAGVACVMYCGDYDNDGFVRPDWKDHLAVCSYKPSVGSAVEAAMAWLEDKRPQ